MIALQEYLQDPCGTLSIPFWKWMNMPIPPQMKIVHHRDFSANEWEEYVDEPYFRLYHPLTCIPTAKPADYTFRTAANTDFSIIVDIINASYPDISITEEQLRNLTTTKVYAPELWIIAEDQGTGRPTGCAIADLDKEAGEGILEWVQVLPEYRRQGIGKMLVIELLQRMQKLANFATVSGRCNNDTKPEILYRSCGFQGNDIWHILHKK